MSDFFQTIYMVYSLSKYTLKILLLITLLCTSHICFSAVVSGLFHSRVEVESQQISDREQAFNQALVKTLLKVSGRRDLVSDPSIQSMFFPAESYVQSFSYKENPRYLAYLDYQNMLEEEQQNQALTVDQMSLGGSDDRASLNRGSENKAPLESNNIDPSSFEPVPLPYLLQVDFAPQALEAKMKTSNLPIWGNVRPEIMFWVVIESNGVRQLVGTTQPNGFKDSLINASSSYALPVSLPYSDGIDMHDLNLSDLWGLFPDAIDQAKLRYASNGNVMVRVYQSMSNTWSANWNFSINEMSYTGQLHNSSISAINDEIMSFVSSILANRFSIQSSNIATNQAILIEVSDINDFKDYVDIQTFFENLPPIKSFSLDWIEGSIMSFSIELNGSTEQFREYLALSGKLQFLSTSTKEVLPEPVYFAQDENLLYSQEQISSISSEVDQDAISAEAATSTEAATSLETATSPEIGVNTLDSELKGTVSIEYKHVDNYKWLSTTPNTNRN